VRGLSFVLCLFLTFAAQSETVLATCAALRLVQKPRPDTRRRVWVGWVRRYLASSMANGTGASSVCIGAVPSKAGTLMRVWMF